MEHSPETMLAHEQERFERLRKDFRAIFEHKSVNSAAANTLFEKIAELYQGAGRAYHTLEHIDHLLSFFNKMRSNIKDWQATRLAAWFHDAIYNTKANDNEEQSAQLARRELTQLGISDVVIDHVEKLVRATAKHQVIDGDEDSTVFLDGDLAILGAEDDEYDKYAAAIRQEYSWVPDEEYSTGRRRILEGFLSRPRIYYSDAAHNTLEAQARKNLQREIQHIG